MFNEVHKNFGFGCMRLPMKGNDVDYAEFNKMIDAFIQNGFNYFDTAHGYLQGKSETALRDCLVKRYPRDKYILTNKLTQPYFKTEDDVRPFFERQLKLCGVDYFDFYLMHAQSKEIFSHFKKCRAYEQALEFKAEGKIKHFGISFHDTAEVLDQILTEYPQVEVVQIQLNYVDYDDPAVQSRKCLEVCNKHNKPVIVMEPVKGGNLVNLPESAKKCFSQLGNASTASYAIRFAAGCNGVFMVLSGMSDLAQMQDNISNMKDFKPLDEREMQAVQNVCAVFKGMNLIACTACRYCIDGCPKKISIPDLFVCMNTKNIYHDWNTNYYYDEVHTKNKGRASDCIKCGKCEKACPQHLPIRDLLKNVANEFEK
ncbi:MAG: aldo/keto reductase [Clostridiales bacterium]|nr:aldo/keto reductase [Clostridiales bacterium]